LDGKIEYFPSCTLRGPFYRLFWPLAGCGKRLTAVYSKPPCAAGKKLEDGDWATTGQRHRKAIGHEQEGGSFYKVSDTARAVAAPGAAAARWIPTSKKLLKHAKKPIFITISMKTVLKKDQAKQLRTYADLYPVMQQVLLRQDKLRRSVEHLWVVSLNHKLWIQNIELINIGSANRVHTQPALPAGRPIKTLPTG
jgi:hypothetical protein